MKSALKRLEGWVFYLTYYQKWDPEAALNFAWALCDADRANRDLPALDRRLYGMQHVKTVC